MYKKIFFLGIIMPFFAQGMDSGGDEMSRSLSDSLNKSDKLEKKNKKKEFDELSTFNKNARPKHLKRRYGTGAPILRVYNPNGKEEQSYTAGAYYIGTGRPESDGGKSEKPESPEL